MTQVFVQDMNYFQGGQQFFHVDLIFSLNFYNFREHFDQLKHSKPYSHVPKQ